jgi:3(or 17)beta-hydroxysteroid dehydrogenase
MCQAFFQAQRRASGGQGGKPMTGISGKVAVVTGAASGMGAATLRRLRLEGAEVLGTDIQEELGRTVAKNAGAHFAVQDVSDPERWREVADLAHATFGRLDILVNNAGTTSGKSIEDVDMETWDRMIGINLTGTMLGCKEAIRLMRGNPEGPSGAIVNIASTTAYTALPHDVGYTAAKSGVRMLTKSVAVHCAKAGLGIRCNAIIPGAIDTGLFAAADKVDPELRHRVAATSPLGRLGTPEEIAAAVAFLVSDECPYMTGAEMMIEGAALAVHPGF